MPIGFKLAGALAAPLVGLLAITTIEVTQTSRAVAEVRSQTELATTTIGPAGITTGLQDERNFAVAELIGMQDQVTLPTKGYEETRRNTDDAVEQFRAELGRKGGDIAAAYEPALDRLAELATLRRDIDANRTARWIGNAPYADGVFSRYARLIEPFLSANSRVAGAVDDPRLRTGAELVDASSRQIETFAALVRVLLLAVLENGLDQRNEVATAAGLKAAFERTADDIRATEREPYQSLLAEAFPEAVTDDLLSLADVAISGGAYDLTRLTEIMGVPQEQSYPGFRDRVAAALQREADDLDAAADNRVLLFAALATVVLAVALVAMWLVARSITRPLRSLTTQATDMANHRLPDAVLDILETPMGENVVVPEVAPIRVHTRDEVADVAEALNTVQDSALELAVEQAVLRRNIADSFVNLGRRNQNLLGRQLDFITELEHNEADPDTLGNLFRLDHLATRMRRNAESLLVLAGIDPPRKWAAPVKITDVIRAALGEVEDYQRVTVRAVEPATIMGSVAADLAHLMAELIENALIFSPPDQNVEIRGRAQPGSTPHPESPDRHTSAPRYGYTLAIIDAGLGIPPDDLSRANRRLAGAESFTIAPSKYLGHYVAGNLAARHNINVQLHNSPGHGITATINLPPALLTTEAIGDAAPGAPELPTHRAAVVADQAPAEAEPAMAPEPVAAAAGTAAPDGRTTSGLTKRPRAASDPNAIPTQPGRTRPLTPSDDLIEALAKHTTGLHNGSPLPAPSPSPSLPRLTPRRPAARSAPPSPAPPSPAPPPQPPSPSSPSPQPPAPAAPRTPAQPPAPAAPRTPAQPPTPAAPRTPAQPLAAPQPPSSEPHPGRPRLAPEPGPLAGLRSWAGVQPEPDLTPPEPPLVPLDSTRPPLTPPQPPIAPPMGRDASPGPALPPTSSGLARRVRGAQMPTTQAPALRRHHHGASSRPRPRDEPGRRPPTSRPSDTNGDHRAADEVYSFLSNFSAGVQRGLDESGKPAPDGDSGTADGDGDQEA